MDEGLDLLPESGAHLTRNDLARVMVALRAIITGTEPDEPNRSHTVTIAFVVAEAIRGSGADP